MKILAFAASNSRNSINKDLINYTTKLLDRHEVKIIDINDFDMPIYGIDLEQSQGIPDAARRFLKQIEEADALLISYAEHNGNYAVAYKNLFDWASRENGKVYQGKSILMLSTSPGPGGAKSVLALAKESAHFFNGQVLSSLSIPSFYENFNQEKGELTNPDLVSQLRAALASLESV